MAFRKDVIIIIVGIVGIGLVWSLWRAYEIGQISGEACTEEAKLCPDGSSVGRTGPRCEFAPCPEMSTPYKSGAFLIDGKTVILVNGRAETPAPNSASKIMTQYFGNVAKGDVNEDGQEDVVFLLTQERGGSGTFFYVVAALKTAEGYYGTNAVLLGDRIAPQTTEIRDGKVIVNYAERKIGEPMIARPSVGVSKYLIVSEGVLHE